MCVWNWNDEWGNLVINKAMIVSDHEILVNQSNDETMLGIVIDESVQWQDNARYIVIDESFQWQDNVGM